jgi:hypothetical protein
MLRSDRLRRAVRGSLAAAVAVCAFSSSAAAPVLAASATHPQGTRHRCLALTQSVAVGPAPCIGNTDAATETYEAIIAGAGLLFFTGGAVVYRRRRSAGSGPAAPSRPRPV